MPSIDKRFLHRRVTLFWRETEFAGRRGVPLLQCKQEMTDWKQITARIRRARTSKDPAGQLSNLFQKTRDAMVAFELAKYFESSRQNADAPKWYSPAAERFRPPHVNINTQQAPD